MYLYLVDFVSLEGLDAPCVTRGYLWGSNLERLEAEASRWADEKVRLMGDRLWKGLRFTRWVKRENIPKGMNLDGFEDIRVSLKEQDRRVRASVAFFETQMDGFNLDRE